MKKININKSNIKRILMGILILVVLSETGYYGYFFMQKQQEVNMYKDKIKTIKIDIQTLKNMENLKKKNIIARKVRESIKREFENHTYKFGAKTGRSIVMEKIVKPGCKVAYYRVKLKFSVDSYKAAKLLLTTLYLHDNLVKIESVDFYNGNMLIIIKEKI